MRSDAISVNTCHTSMTCKIIMPSRFGLLVVSLLSSRYFKRNAAVNLQSLIHLMKSVAYL